MKHGLWIGMFLVTFIAAVHYNYGSDYPEYYYKYNELIRGSYTLKQLLFGELSNKNEPGWLLLQYLFKPFGEAGFYLLVASLSVFQGVVIYRLIKRYVQPQYYVFALFIYLFNTTLYVGSFSGIRQHFAVAVVASVLPLILEKKVIVPLLILIANSTIHTSAAIFIPFVFWGFLPNKRKLIATVYFLFFVVLFLNKELINDILDQFFLIEDFEHYQSNLDVEKETSYGLGFIVSLIPFVLSLYYLLKEKDNGDIPKIVALATIGFVILPITTSVSLGSRMAYYFEIFSIIGIPYCFSVLRDKSLRIALISVYVLFMLYAYNGYFHSELRYESTYVYHSIFELLF